MVTLEWDLDRADGVTFVRVYVTAQRPCRVQVENRLDGPVWPPRRRGQLAAGWEDGGFVGVVAPDERLVGGYATPAPPDEPPVELVAEESVDATERPVGATERPVDPVDGAVDPVDGAVETADGTVDPAEDGDSSADTTEWNASVPSVGSTPGDVVRTLGNPVVPRDAVPLAGPDGESASEQRAGDRSGSGVQLDGELGGERPKQSWRDDAGEETPSRVGGRGGGDDLAEAADAANDAVEFPDERTEGGADSDTDPARELVVPGAVRAWLADVERRVAAVEQRQERDRESALDAPVAADRQALDHVADRVLTLSDRARTLDQPDAVDPTRGDEGLDGSTGGRRRTR